MNKYSLSEYRNLEYHLAKAREWHFGFESQVFCDPQQLDDRAQILPDLKARLAGLDGLSLHGPFWDLAPASRDAQIVAVTRRRFHQACEAAAALGARQIVLHSGFVPKTYSLELWLRNTLAFWKSFLQEVNAEVAFHIENVYDDDPRWLARLIDDLGTPRVSVCLDTGHVNANSSRPMREWIETLNDRIRHVHLHNNGGQTDDHNGLADGTLDMKETFELLDQHAPEAVLALETKDVDGSVRWLKENGYL